MGARYRKLHMSKGCRVKNKNSVIELATDFVLVLSAVCYVHILNISDIGSGGQGQSQSYQIYSDYRSRPCSCSVTSLGKFKLQHS